MCMCGIALCGREKRNRVCDGKIECGWGKVREIYPGKCSHFTAKRERESWEERGDEQQTCVVN